MSKGDRFVIMHCEDAMGNPLSIAHAKYFKVNMYWRKGGVFVTKEGALDYAQENLLWDSYKIVQLER